MKGINIYGAKAWSKLTEDVLKTKINLILENIPVDTKTICDVGCGNGLITNKLNQFYEVVGVDSSIEAIEGVNGKKICASCDNIPINDQKFDMVFSSELLEHLDEETFQKTVKEFQRLSSKYLFITVPNHENPNKLSIKCPNCKTIFNRPYHLRSFAIKDFHHTFDEFVVVKHFVHGKKVRYYNPVILKLKRLLSPSISWIPYYWIHKDARDTMCPSCGVEFYYSFRFNLLSFACDVLNVLISPKRPYWLFVLLERKQN